MKNTRLAYIIGIAGAIGWGVSFIGTKTALDYLDPIQVMAVRMTIAVITFGVFIAVGPVKLNFKNKSIKNLLILSIAQPCLYGIFEILGIDMTTASESAIILSMVPITVTVLSGIFLKEKIKFMTAGFVFLSFLGVIVTVMDNLSASGKTTGYMFLLLAVITGAVFTMLSKQISGSFGPIEITFVMTAVGFIFFNALNLIMGYGFEAYALTVQIPELLYAILFLGVICSVFAFIAYNHLIAAVPAYKASTLTLSVVTVTGVIAGIVFRGDPFTIHKVIGLVLILTGVIGVSQPEKLI
ncbi:MAG: DMT family transporter [Peptostreptococcaceae bacterium]|nr:DMT family transporter [Peptostreptococcaceae bacterium]